MRKKTQFWMTIFVTLWQLGFAAQNVHGIVDVTLKNDYVTPRGLLVSNKGLTTQVLIGLDLDVYEDPSGFLNKMAFTGFIWNDIWSDQHHPTAKCWNEMDWGIGAAFTLAQDFRLKAEYLQFLSPPGNFKPENNFEVTLGYDDSKWNLPVIINPYAKWFWAMSGSSTVTVGKEGRTFDVELGAIPTLDFRNGNYPCLLSAPTWITVGPADFWNGGKQGLKHKDSNFGVFSTGLRAEVPSPFIPKTQGDWYIHGGLQYYRLINDSLREAQKITLGKTSFSDTHRNIYVVSAGVGFRF